MNVVRRFSVTIFILAILALSLVISNQSFAQNTYPPLPLFADAVAPEGRNVSRDNKIIRSRFVTLDLDLLFSIRKEPNARQDGQSLLLNLFDDALYVMLPDNFANQTPGQLIWRGTIKGEPSSTVMIAVNQDTASGTVRVKNKLYKLHYAGDGRHVITQIDLTKPWLEEPPIRVALPEADTPAKRPQVPSDDGSIIDMMVLYTPATRQQFGSTAGMEAEIDLAIAEANQAYINSEINTQLRLVHTAEVSYSASGNLGTDLDRIKKVDDGYMDQIHALRDTYKADLVSFLVEDSSDGRCGVGYLMDELSHDFESWGFNVLRGDCATGSYTFAHEVGHNMGSEHDPNHVQNPPLHSFSYGYWGPNNSFRTIMAYNCSGGCPKIQYFSNPNVTYNGVPTGNSSQDNARSINSVLSTVANFRVSADTPPPSSGTLELRVSQSSDDVEEDVSDGGMNLSSSDLELGADNGTDQTVGIRFQNVALPQGATIQAAYIEFETDSTDSVATSVQIRAEDSDSAAAFTSSNHNLTNRSVTSTSVNWSIPAWNTVDETHQSPDISALVQEVINRGGWSAYNSMVFVISGSGERTAESYDGESPAAPLLHIEYTSSSTSTPTPTGPSPTPAPTVTPGPGGSNTHFAVIGDFGTDDSNEAEVANLVDSWSPEFIVTVGDNVYGSSTFDAAVGQYYCDYLADVTPDAGSPDCNGGNSATNKFFPAFGNHDYDDGPIDGAADYLNYFTLPGSGITSSGSSGSELYYDFVQGSVHFFVIDSESISNDGEAGSSQYNTQRNWLQTQLAASTSPWQMVFFHHAAYSSSNHGSYEWMQWPFASWGADAVFNGHDHVYERINRDGIVYFVNGLGGRGTYDFGTPVEGSQVRYNDAHGAMLMDANANGVTFNFVNVSGQIIDTYSIGTPPPTATPTPAPTVAPNGTVDVRVSQSSDDVEERVSDGDMGFSSSDLELGADNGTEQTVGIRFQDVTLPQGATIQSAYIEFETDSTNSGTTSVQIRAEDSDNAAAFASSNYNVTNRSVTSAAVNWSIPAWDTTNEKHQSPDLSALVQEVVNRGGWSPYNSMVFVISGSGERTAESYDGEALAAPLLHIEYTSSSSTATPTATPSATPSAIPSATPTPTVSPSVTAIATTISSPTPTATATLPPSGNALVKVADYNVSLGNTITVGVDVLNLANPGLGSATIDVFYDQTVLNILSCQLDPSNEFDAELCNPSAGNNHISFTVLSSQGVAGEARLANLVFQVIGESGNSSPINVSITTFSGVDGVPIPVSDDDGSVTIGLMGDVSCDNSRDAVDGLFILQYTVGFRASANTCPLGANTLLTSMCDTNADQTCNVLDAMFIVQCTVGLTNPLCPATRALNQASHQNETADESWRPSPATIMIGSQTVYPSQTVTIPVSATIPLDDALFATTIEVHYNPAVVDSIGCQIDNAFIGTCNPHFDHDGIAPDIIKFSLIPPTGASGEIKLADITLTGIELGDAALTLNVETFSNASGTELPIQTVNNPITVNYPPTALTINRLSVTADGMQEAYLLLVTLLMVLILGITRHYRKA